MWRPESWEDLEAAIGVQVERVDLDFKRELPPGNRVRDLAKDAAAMGIEGGVIIVGVDEQDGVASQLTPFDLAGAIERVQQIIDARLTPALVVEIAPIRKKEGDQDGVLVITIPQSWSAPHQYEDRYPARAGSTTRYLEEREVEAFYRRRAELRAAPAGGGGVVGHAYPPGIDGFVDHYVGLLKIHLRPVGGGRHPAEPYLRPPLGEAVARATEDFGAYVAPPYTATALEDLRPWKPAGAGGWQAGRFVGEWNELSGVGPAVGAMYRYGDGFSFTVTLALADELGEVIEGEREPPRELFAYEQLWTVETLALLRIGGQFFAPVPETSVVRADLELAGLLDATSFLARERALLAAPPKVTENIYDAGGIYPARDLADDPRDAVHELLDPFMIAILPEGVDVVDEVATQG